MLADFAAVAAQHDLRWYLFGAQAVALYGVQRTSADLDVTIELGRVPPRDLVRDLATRGLRAREDDRFIAEHRVIPAVHEATGWPMDIVLAGPGLEELFLDAARAMPLGRRKVPVIAPAHLVVTKVLAGRPKDLEDVRGLLRAPGLDLDLSEADEILALLEEALDRRDLRSRLRELVSDTAAGGR